MMYKLCSFATSTICLKAFSLNTKPVGLFGLIKQIATVLGVILLLMSSISGDYEFKSTENSIGIPPCNLTYEAYGG